MFARNAGGAKCLLKRGLCAYLTAYGGRPAVACAAKLHVALLHSAEHENASESMHFLRIHYGLRRRENQPSVRRKPALLFVSEL
eukprot:1654696-Pleurochrysis_carterae.AAC.1